MERLLYKALIFVATTLSFAILIRVFFRYLQERLELSHRPTNEELARFVKPPQLLARRFYGALISALVLFILQLAFGVEKMQIAVPVSCAAGVVTYWLVLAYYRRKVIKRKEAFDSKLLDLTMGLANGMKSGLALGQALDAVAKRIGNPMQEEIAVVLRENRLGVDFPTAFEKLNRRMPSEDLHLLTTSIALTTRSGGSLVEVLNEMVVTIRARTDFHGRLKNMTAQGRYEALMISLAPVAAFVIFYFIDPVLMKPLVQTGTGWIAIGVAACLIAAGYSVLRKITTVEV